MQSSMRGPLFGFLMDLPRKTDFEAEVTRAGTPFVVVLLYNPRWFFFASLSSPGNFIDECY